MFAVGMQSNISRTSFAERTLQVQALHEECARAERGEPIDLRQTTAKLGSLVEALKNDSKALRSPEITPQLRSAYQAHRKGIIGLTARVDALSPKGISIPEWVKKPAVYTALSVAALVLAYKSSLFSSATTEGGGGGGEHVGDPLPQTPTSTTPPSPSPSPTTPTETPPSPTTPSPSPLPSPTTPTETPPSPTTPTETPPSPRTPSPSPSPTTPTGTQESIKDLFWTVVSYLSSASAWVDKTLTEPAGKNTHPTRYLGYSSGFGGFSGALLRVSAVVSYALTAASTMNVKGNGIHGHSKTKKGLLREKKFWAEMTVGFLSAKGFGVSALAVAAGAVALPVFEAGVLKVGFGRLPVNWVVISLNIAATGSALWKLASSVPSK